MMLDIPLIAMGHQANFRCDARLVFFIENGILKQTTKEQRELQVKTRLFTSFATQIYFFSL